MRRAISEATKLSDSQQDAPGAIVLQEINSERLWDELFDRPESHDRLSRLADEALAAHRAGRTRELDPDDL